MLKHWWKILGVLMLLAVIIFGLLTPLSSGVSNADLIGENILISGYNSNFSSEDESLEIWLKSDDQYICAKGFNVENEHEILSHFIIPKEIKSKSLDLFLYSNSTDTLVLQSAIRFNDAIVSENVNSCAVETENNASTAFSFPYREILYETIRNLFFHVPMWFAMMVILFVGFVYSIKYLGSENPLHDTIAQEAVKVGLLFGILGLATGAIWAKFTWGSWWVFQDIKLNGAAISTLMYLAYMVLRNSIDEEHKRGKVSAVYNIFAYIMFIVFIMVIPRLKGSESLHPGNGGNPAFSNYDLDSSLRTFFYPAVIGWILLGVWFLSIRIRLEKIKSKLD